MDKRILLHSISPDEPKQLMKEVIKEKFINLKKDLAVNKSDVLLTRSETCELLKIDSSTL